MIKKYLPLLTLLISVTFLSAQNSMEFTKSQRSQLEQNLVKEGFPASLVPATYPITQESLAQLLRILALLNSYQNIYLTYDNMIGDWYLTINNSEPLYWADGRLIPKSELANSQQYRPYIGYQWREEAADMRTWSKERLERFQNSTKPQTQRNRTLYHGTFHHLLYGGHNRITIEDQLVRVNFLGTNLKLNKLVAPALERVNKKIMQARQKDTSLEQFLVSLSEPSSYLWRTIAGSNTVSFHSYGIAVDINPKHTVKPIYWQWERARNAQWYFVGPEDRWQIHPTVLQAFLDEGFLWGGIWPQYDIMHFEYRPELKELARLNQLFSPYLAN